MPAKTKVKVAAKRELSVLREEFVESIGLVAQNEGMPRIAGRVFGLLVFENGPYSFSELAELLQVSRGSISSSVRMLQEMGVIERVAKPGDRQDYFQLSKTPYATLLQRATQRAEKARSTIAGFASQVRKSSDGVRKRLDAYATFYGAIAESMNAASKKV